MAGKAYTMREMKKIVEYLTEHKSYGEIKGRKMWMEFANSQQTTRSWQSLKETFLKRILPDLHNPYYSLSMDQVRSFKQGYDVAEREKSNRLEIQTSSQESNDNAKIHTGNNLSNTRGYNNPSTSHNDGPTKGIDNVPSSAKFENEMEKATGETTSAKIESRNRSSADTLVLEYENAEDVQRALESPECQDEEIKSKSLKDLLSFETMTPHVKELLDDFETESESSDKEPQLKIVEDTSEEPRNTNAKPMRVDVPTLPNIESNNDVQIVLQNTEDLNPLPLENLMPPAPEEIALFKSQDNNNEPIKDIAPKENQDEEPSIYSEQVDSQHKNDEPQKEKLLETHDEPQKSKNEVLQKGKPKDNNKDITKAQEANQESLHKTDTTNIMPQDSTEFVTAESSNLITSVQNKSNIVDNTSNSIPNTGNTSSDTLLPNNQEGLNVSNKVTPKPHLDNTINEEKKIANNKKSSHDDIKNKEQKLSDDKSNEDDDIHSRVTPVIELSSDKPLNNHDTASIVTKETEIPSNKVIEINTDTPTNNTIEQINAHLNNPGDKPSTSKQKEVFNANADEIIELDGGKNPCLLSVSLYDEQFKDHKYSDDSYDEATSASKQNKDKIEVHRQKEEKTHKTNRKRKIDIAEDKHNPNREDVLKSRSNNDSQRQITINKNRSLDNKALSLQREKALANVFGFAHGAAASTSRKRHLSHRSHHRQRRCYSNHSSNSSEWTSESDSESYVSPPRGRKNRHTRKYLKPKSSRILQDPEEGMLFVMFGKKIYPLVKDGKQIKNYLTYRPDSDSDMEQESYWKQKYVDERKRVDEFKKILNRTRVDKGQEVNDRNLLSSPRNGKDSSPQKLAQNRNAEEIAAPVVAQTELKDDKLILKIASKSGLEYCLEGGWTQISNAMPQVVQILRSESNMDSKNPSPRKRADSDRKSTKSEDTYVVSSRMSTPVNELVADPEVHEKVSVLETEIFKEIEKLEKQDQVEEKEVETTNITTRRGRSRKASSSSLTTVSSTPAKRTRASKASTESKDTKPINKKRKPKQMEEPEVEPTKIKRASNQKEVTNEESEPKQNVIEKPPTKAKAKAKADQTDAIEKTTTNQDNVEQAIDKKLDQNTNKKVETGKAVVKNLRPPSRRENLRLPKQRVIGEQETSIGKVEKSPAPTRSSSRQSVTPRKYDTDSSASDTRLRTKKATSKESKLLLGFDDEDARYMFPPTSKTDKLVPNETTVRRSPRLKKISQANSPISSNDQGYQDSDTGPMIISLPKRKRKLSFTAQKKHKNRRVSRRKSYPTELHNFSSDSNSTYFVPLRKSLTLLNSDIYKSDSYLQLCPKKIKDRLPLNRLAPIDETGLTQFSKDTRHFSSVSKDSNKSNDSSNIVLEIGSSSNVSLPLSPELSVVEKLSVSREIIKNARHPTINEIQSNGNKKGKNFSEYMISNLDVSVPLMDQQCTLESSNLTIPSETTINQAISNLQTDKTCSIKVENLTLSQSLDQRLKNLLLESGKKTRLTNNLEKHAMEIDGTQILTSRITRSKTQKEQAMEVDGSMSVKTARAKKTNKTESDKENVLEDDRNQIVTRTTRSKSQKEKIEVDKCKTSKTKKSTRSSTPQKKKNVRKAKVLSNSVIEEEHMEFCSFGGRRSCPPVITILPIDENANNCDDVNLNITKNVTRKKKDIIRVKIQRPVSRNKNRETSIVDKASSSIYTDSGINDSGNLSGFLLKGNDSVDLIHNHSETCLMANECIGNSVEFVDQSKSIISVDSEQESFDSELKRLFDNAAADFSGGIFSNGRDYSVSEPKTSGHISKSPEREFFSPNNINSSLITEDLSDEPPTQPSKWYLFSEDETTLAASMVGSFGSSLRQIFPVMCSVPDLSTITEASNSNKQSCNGDGNSCDANRSS